MVAWWSLPIVTGPVADWIVSPSSASIVASLRDESQAVAFQCEQQDLGLARRDARDQRSEIGFRAGRVLLADDFAAELVDDRLRRVEHLVRPGAIGTQHEITLAERLIHVGQQLGGAPGWAPC